MVHGRDQHQNAVHRRRFDCRRCGRSDMAIGTRSRKFSRAANHWLLTILGGLIVFGLFINCWSLNECSNQFVRLAEKAFHKLRRFLVSHLTDSCYCEDNIEEAPKEAFGLTDRCSINLKWAAVPRWLWLQRREVHPRHESLPTTRAVLQIKIFQRSIETLFITGSIEHDTSFCLDDLLNLQKFKRSKRVRISLSPFEMIDNETTANKVATFFNPPILRRLRFDGPWYFQCTKFLNLALQRPYNIVEVTGAILCICDTDNEPWNETLRRLSFYCLPDCCEKKTWFRRSVQQASQVSSA